MSQTVIFGVGSFVFALTVWGSVMAGGIWLGRLADVEDAQTSQTPAIAQRDPSDGVGAPDQE